MNFFSFKIVKPLFLNISLISFSRFLSTASGLIIDKVCSNITHNDPLLVCLIILLHNPVAPPEFNAPPYFEKAIPAISK